MRRAAQNEVQRNQVGGIEQMINARRNFAAAAFKGLAGIVRAAMDFVVAVGKTAARQADGKVRVRPQPVDKAELGIEIHRRHRQPERQVRAQEIRLVVIIKRVAGERRVALECLIVAELDQVALDRVNLREAKTGANNVSHSSARPIGFIAAFVTQSRAVSKRIWFGVPPSGGPGRHETFPTPPEGGTPNGPATQFTPRWTRGKFSGLLLRQCRHSTLNCWPKPKSLGFSDRQIAHLTGTTEDKIRALRKKLGLVPSYRLVDTCAAEFEAYTPYYYSTYDRGDDEVKGNTAKKVMILGGGPNRIGQGIEFDYCCVHAAFALKEDGFETIMVNSNPETVSTDYDTSDKLFFEPLTLEDVLHIYEREMLGGDCAIRRADAVEPGARPPEKRRQHHRHLAAKHRDCRGPQALRRDARQAENSAAAQRHRHQRNRGARGGEKTGYPVLVRPSFVLGGRAMQIVYSDAELQHYMRFAVEASPERPVLVDKFLEDATEVDVDCIADVGQFKNPDDGTLSSARCWSTSNLPAFIPATPRWFCRRTPFPKSHRDHSRIHPRDGARVEGHRPDERAIRGEGRKGLCARSQPARLAHRAVREQGDWFSAGQTRREGHGRKNLEGTRLHQGNLAEVLGGEGIRVPVQPLSRAGHPALAGNALDRRGHGLDADRGIAYAKSQMAAGSPLPLGGKVFISVSDAHKKEVAAVAKQFADLGFELAATGGTAAVLEKAGLNVQRVFKLAEGRPNAIDLLKNKEIQLVINTPAGESPRADEVKIRTTAVYTGTPIMTTLSGAKAAARGIAALKKSGYGVQTLQEYQLTRSASARSPIP
jgi:carbamoyl-phosphate synthase large subunit